MNSNRQNNFELPKKINRYILTELIGSGGFGRVYKACHEAYEDSFAVKVYPLKQERTESAIKSFDNEVSALKNLDHPNIIRIYNHFQDDDYLYIVLEYCSNGTIEDIIFSKESVPYNRKMEYCRQIISAVAYCHERKIAHRDLKPSNILIDSRGRIKLADFGLSLSTHVASKTEIFTGSYSYLSPEIVKKEPHCPIKSDLWSLGVVLYYLVSGYHMFPTDTLDSLLAAIRSGIYPPLSTEFKDIDRLIHKMVVVNPDCRLKLTDRKIQAFLKSSHFPAFNSRSQSDSKNDFASKRSVSVERLTIAGSTSSRLSCANLFNCPGLLKKKRTVSQARNVISVPPHHPHPIPSFVE